MGRSYKKALGELASSYEWALLTEIEELLEFVSESRSLPLVAVGSGGSHAAAIFTSILHQKMGMISKHMTPLEFVSSSYDWRGKSVILITARGGNSDIIASIRTAMKKEPSQLMVLCARKDSPIGKISRTCSFIKLLEVEPPKKDGFLATNSLLTFSVLLARAYMKCFGFPNLLPVSMEQLIHPNQTEPNSLSPVKNDLQSLLRRDTLIVLYGNWGKPAAFDLESKFTEAAFRNVQLADYRNFAHGRHYWLAKRPRRSGVISISTADDQLLAKQILDQIPAKIPIARVDSIFPGPAGTIGLLIKTMHLIGVFSEFEGEDPGRPEVPEFGRRLYHLRIPSKIMFRSQNPIVSSLSPFIMRALRRKILTPINLINDKELIDFWVGSCNKFVEKIQRKRFDAVVFDYDGTLCERKNRFEGASKLIGEELERLLENGVLVGIATGRGKSVRNDLQRVISREHWPSVVIGYYNGSDTGLLNDKTRPTREKSMEPQISEVTEYLKKANHLNHILTSECRPTQITITPKLGSVVEIEHIMRNLQKKSFPAGIQVLESDHSIDVLAPGVSKLNVVKKLRKILSDSERGDAILCIGDKGRWPGNDFYLLSTQYSLSVDTVSTDPDTCWNIAPEAHKGIQATRDYLSTMKFGNEQIYVELRSLIKGIK